MVLPFSEHVPLFKGFIYGLEGLFKTTKTTLGTALSLLLPYPYCSPFGKDPLKRLKKDSNPLKNGFKKDRNTTKYPYISLECALKRPLKKGLEPLRKPLESLKNSPA